MLLQADATAHLFQVLLSNPPVFRIVEQKIGELGALIHQMHGREPRALFLEPADAEHLAQEEAGIVEAERLIEVTGQQIVLWVHGRLTTVCDRAATSRRTMAASRNACSSGARRGRPASAAAPGRSVSGAGAQ